MNRRELLRHLNNHGCVLLREGGNHSWWSNPEKNKLNVAMTPRTSGRLADSRLLACNFARSTIRHVLLGIGQV